MRRYAPELTLVALAFVMALLVAYVGASKVMGEPASSASLIVQYVAISGGVALVVGLVVVLAGIRWLPRLSLEIGLAYLAGSVGAIFTVIYTPLLMFKDPGDLHLLVLLLVCFLVISLGLGSAVAVGVSRRVRRLNVAARTVAQGFFDERVALGSKDEIAELAHSFNVMSQRLGESFDRQQIMEQDRRGLVAAVSHDLRTPLASVRAMVEAITDGVVTDPVTVAQYHSSMLEHVDRLGRLIDDLLHLSRLDSGVLELKLAQTDIGELITETVESFRPTADRQGIEISMKQDVSGQEVRVDPDQLHRVLTNLLQNSLQHTERGGSVVLEAKIVEKHLVIHVTDTGEGIPAEDRPKIFDMFYRGEKSRGWERGEGSGLGLAIARAIVEAHHGDIWLEDECASGSKFTFRVPLVTAQVAPI